MFTGDCIHASEDTPGSEIFEHETVDYVLLYENWVFYYNKLFGKYSNTISTLLMVDIWLFQVSKYQ